MPSKQKNTRQAQHHHAHTISRSTNLNYLNPYQPNPYATTAPAANLYHQYPYQPTTATTTTTNYNSIGKQQLLKSSQTLNNYTNYNGGTPVMNSYYSTVAAAAAANNNNYDSLPLIPPPPQAASLMGAEHRGAPIMMHKQLHESLMSTIEHQAMPNRPLCRCRVMYLGSSVPHITKNGLHGIQEPLRHLYPEEQFCGQTSTTKGNSSVSSSLSSSSNTAGCQSNTSGTSGVHSGGGNQTTATRSSNTIDISHLSSGLGIDSWLSVWSNGLLLENFDEFGREVKRFFSIESLHYCAAVRFFDTNTLASSGGGQRMANGGGQLPPMSNVGHPVDTMSSMNENSQHGDQNNNTIAPAILSSGSGLGQDGGRIAATLNNNDHNNQQTSHQRPTKSMARFLPLDAPLFQCPGMVDTNHPPVFAAIMRRTTGIKVLECHAFICRRDAASNALVRCCTQAYADLLAAKRLSLELGASQLCGATASAGGRVSLLYHHADLYSHHPQQHHHRDGGDAASESRHRGRTSRSLQRPSGGGGGGSVSRRPLSNHSSSKQSSWSPYETVGVEVPARNCDKLNGDDGSNEDNSLEVSSEDNYAIIPKHHYDGSQKQHHHHHQKQQQPSRAWQAAGPELVGGGMQPVKLDKGHKIKPNDRQPGDGTFKGATRRSDYRSKAGSSKSLYPDFMPKAGERSSSSKRNQSSNGRGGSMKAREKDNRIMSHSVDVIEQLGATCCRQEMEKGDDEDNDNGRGSVKYSLVGSKRQNNCNPTAHTKRHSRSMQNLDGPYEFSALEANRQSQRRRAKHRRSSKGSATTKTLGHEDRRSASYNDISDGDHLRGRHHIGLNNSGSRQGSELTMASNHHHQPKQSRSTSKQSLAAAGPSSSSESGQPVSLPVISNNNSSTFGYSARNHPPPPPPPPPLEGPTCEGRQPLYGDLGGTTTTNQSRRHRAHSKSSLLGAQQQPDAAERQQQQRSVAKLSSQEVYLTNGDTMTSGSRRPTSSGTTAKYGANSRRRDGSSSRRRNAASMDPYEPTQATLGHHHPAYFSASHLGALQPAHPYGPTMLAAQQHQQQQPQYYPAMSPQTAAGLYHQPLPAYYLPPAAAAYHPNQASHTSQFHHRAHPAHFHPQMQHQQQHPMYGPAHFLYSPSDPASVAAAAGAHPMANLPGLHYPIGQPPSGCSGGQQTYGGDRKSSSHSRAAKALASGFRCLSPPMNFLTSLKRQSTASCELSQSRQATGNNNNNNNNARILESAAPTANATKQVATGSSELPQPAEPGEVAIAAAAAAQTNAINSITAIDSPIDDVDHQGSSRHPDPATIVSARPGFLLSSAAAAASSTYAPNRDKKMSWIKRLSLTMSSSQDSPTSLPSPSPTETMAPTTATTNGLEQRERKKRSGLFSGSLTIGRRSRQQRQQQQQPSNGKMVAA